MPVRRRRASAHKQAHRPESFAPNSSGWSRAASCRPAPCRRQTSRSSNTSRTTPWIRPSCWGSSTNRIEVLGAIGNGAAGNADVDWYNFTLASPSAIHLAAALRSGQSAPVLSLYNSDPNDFGDLFDPLGHRLLDQESGSAISASLDAGTYYVAVSGAGNAYFDPFLAGSGYPGQPCTYDLQLTATNLNLAPADGPIVLSATPGAAPRLSSSPLVVRLDLSGAIDPNTVIPGQTVQLTFNPTGQFGNGNDQSVALGRASM